MLFSTVVCQCEMFTNHKINFINSSLLKIVAQCGSERNNENHEA